MKTLFTVGLIAILVIGLITALPLTHTFAASKADKNAAKAIQKALDKFDSKHPSNVAILNGTVKTTPNQVITIYNATKGATPNPPPNPPPTPTGETTKVCLVGDFKDNSVVKKMTDCNVKVSLGDSGYGSNLNLLKSLGFTKCVIGNHDAEEDGSKAIYQEALAYCGDHWSLKTANGTTLIIGMNTNGDTQAQVSAVKQYLASDTTIKTVILLSHKGGHVPPSSHHPAEAANLYSQLEKLVPTNVKLIEVFGHNHVSSSAPSKNWYQAGGGGKSHYSCGTDSTWTFCDNSKYGYLEVTISNKDGATAAKFVN